MRDEEPFNNIKSISRWFAEMGYKGVQVPTWDPRAIDLDRAAESKAYCDDYKGMLAELGLEPTELASYLAELEKLRDLDLSGIMSSRLIKADEGHGGRPLHTELALVANKTGAHVTVSQPGPQASFHSQGLEVLDLAEPPRQRSKRGSA